MVICTDFKPTRNQSFDDIYFICERTKDEKTKPAPENVFFAEDRGFKFIVISFNATVKRINFTIIFRLYCESSVGMFGVQIVLKIG